MIVKDNRALYENLFRKAENVLKNRGHENVSINNIDDYFSYIKELGEYEQEMMMLPQEQRGDFDPIFMVLPLDEPTFKINANTREIDTKNFTGKQVVGDQIAEIIWFSVARYFDTTDLYNTNIIIQWENDKGNSGISPAFNKVLSLKSKEGEMMFGWPLHSGITENAGTVKFSVRFYLIDEEKENSLAYNLNTIPTTIKINPGINIDLFEEGIEEDTFMENDLIYKRLRQSIIIGTTYPGTPIVSGAPASIYIVGSNGSENVSDLVYDGEKYSLNLCSNAYVAEKDNSGKVEVIWFHSNALNENGSEYARAEMNDSENLNPVYIKSQDTIVNKNKVYYALKNNVYEVVSPEEMTSEAKPSPLSHGWYEYACCFNAEDAGYYKAKAKNTIGTRSKESAFFDGYFYVPFAVQPQFELIANEGSQDFVIDDENAQASIEFRVFAEDGGDISLTGWYKKDRKDESYQLVPMNEEDLSEIIVLEGVENCGYYKLGAKNTKNNNTTEEICSEEVLITEPIKDIVVQGFEAYVSKENDVIENLVVEGNIIDTEFAAFNLKPIVNESEDNLQRIPEEVIYIYSWYKYNSENKEFESVSLPTNNDNSVVISEEGQYKCIITKKYGSQTIVQDEANVEKIIVLLGKEN